MKNTYVRNVGPCAELHRDRKSGIAWIEDGSTGLGHSCHANIDATGSVRGMKALGYWGKEDRTVRSHGFIYNIDTFVVDEEDPYDALPRKSANVHHALREEREEDEQRYVKN